MLVKKWEKHSLKSAKHWSFQLPTSASHVAFRRSSTHEPVMSKLQTSLSSQFFTKLSHSTLTLNPQTYKEMIEQKYNQIWHRIKANKNIVVNHNLTIIIKFHLHHAPLVRRSLYKYKCLWGVGCRGQWSRFKSPEGNFTHIST